MKRAASLLWALVVVGAILSCVPDARPDHFTVEECPRTQGVVLGGAVYLELCPACAGSGRVYRRAP